MSSPRGSGCRCIFGQVHLDLKVDDLAVALFAGGAFGEPEGLLCALERGGELFSLLKVGGFVKRGADFEVLWGGWLRHQE